MDPHLQTRSAQRSRASLIILITLAFLLMVAAVVLVFTLPDDTALTMPAQTTGSLLDASAGFPVSGSEAQHLYPLGSSIMKIDPDRITCLDIHGIEQYGVDIAYASPLAFSSGGLILVVDHGGRGFVLLDESGEICRGMAEGKISGAGISSAGYLALIQDQSDSTGLVSLYQTSDGKKLFDCFNPESGYVLSVAFPPDGSSFDIALVNTAGSAAKSIIKRYAWDGSLLGQRIPDLTELLPLISYDPQQHPVICGATNLAALSYDQDKILWQIRFNQILAVRAHQDGLLVLAREKLDGPCNLYSLAGDGAVRFTLPIGEAEASLELAGDLAVLVCGTHLVAVDSHKGKIILDADITDDIVRVGFAGPRDVTIISRGAVRRLSIPD